MFALGCIQALQCNKNTCPTGITTHDRDLQKGLDPTDKAVRVANYAANMLREVTMVAKSCGVTNPQDLSRQHAFIISDSGLPVLLRNYYPDIHTKPQYTRKSD
jgi:glutamate synthase domain-containing protein 2